MGSRPTTVAGCSILPPLVGSGQVASPQPDSAGIAIAHGASGSHGLARSAAAPAGNLRRAARQVSPARVVVHLNPRKAPNEPDPRRTSAVHAVRVS